MKELIRVRVQYASRQQCCKTHKRPLSLPFNLTVCRMEHIAVKVEFERFKVKVKQSHYRPGQALKVPGG